MINIKRQIWISVDETICQKIVESCGKVDLIRKHIKDQITDEVATQNYEINNNVCIFLFEKLFWINK